ncbi:5-methylcytosine rRNA methyltransferase NSUN4 [Aricia agestis]|uniref:5-methylcytosine rRNA methyltransferase NSUN4 n=1 Tax=Aricia agestis TaxID=91739 RepID=UPI001C201751|nr:5-methylcytosine rRNA methyltransferase NSUN4 [Aricia agestis]
MYSFHSVCRKFVLNSYLLSQTRQKSKIHWSKAKKKTSAKYKAIDHFDEFYGNVFGKQWESMREALFRRQKYVALVNNYGDTEDTVEYLANRGAHCLKNLMTIQASFHNEYSPKDTPSPSQNTNTNMDDYIARLQSEEISSLYPQGIEVPERLEISNTVSLKTDTSDEGAEKNVSKSVSLNDALQEASIDETRIITPQMGVSSESLYQYIPATKLKGMEDWIPESQHISFFTNSSNTDFPLVIEPEMDFQFPEHLKVMTFEMGSDSTKFPEPKRGKIGMFNYYPLDLGSVLAVLALNLRGGERVLDVCAAPGGKTLTALQTMLPDLLVANDSSISRCNRMERIFRDYLIDYDTSNSWRERLLVSRKDGRMIVDDAGFDAVLVDAPCTTDRHSVLEDENNIFRADRVRERLRIPELQAQLIASALQLVRVGGALVYSTCALSPAQNDGALHAALAAAFRDHGVVATVKDLSAPFSSLSSALVLGSGAAKPKYGQLVIPDIAANYGPTYIARIVRVK